MGFFDGLGEKIASTGKDVASKAKDVAEITRLKAEIAAHEGKIKNAYTEIGRLFYENADGEVAEEYVPLMEAVSNEKAALEKCKSDIHKIKGTTVCINCGAEVPADASFCASCGAKIEKADPEVVHDMEEGAKEPQTDEEMAEEAANEAAAENSEEASAEAAEDASEAEKTAE